MLKRLLANTVAGVALIIGAAVGLAHATPITYDFTASDFSGAGGSPAPYSSLSGSVTIDGSTVTGIDLTIGSHTYAPSEVGYMPDWIVGATLSGINGMGSGTNDFYLWGTFSSSPGFNTMHYAVPGIGDIFSTLTGTLSVSVPEPATIALFSVGLAGLGFSRRRKRA